MSTGKPWRRASLVLPSMKAFSTAVSSRSTHDRSSRPCAGAGGEDGAGSCGVAVGKVLMTVHPSVAARFMVSASWREPQQRTPASPG